MSSPQGQQYAQISDLQTFGLSQQFLNSPLFNQTNSLWVASTVYPTDYLVIPYTKTPSNQGLYFEASAGGTSGATEPAWPTTVGATVVDGTTTWTCLGANNAPILNSLLLAASEFVDSYLRSKYKLPLLPGGWGSDIRRVTCWVAAYDGANMRGYNPAIPAEDTYRIRYEQACAWLKNVANGTSTPDVIDSSPSAAPGFTAPNLGPSVTSPSIQSPGGCGLVPTVGGFTRGTWAR